LLSLLLLLLLLFLSSQAFKHICTWSHQRLLPLFSWYAQLQWLLLQLLSLLLFISYQVLKHLRAQR
jgi:hypothetical protein